MQFCTQQRLLCCVGSRSTVAKGPHVPHTQEYPANAPQALIPYSHSPPLLKHHSSPNPSHLATQWVHALLPARCPSRRCCRCCRHCCHVLRVVESHQSLLPIVTEGPGCCRCLQCCCLLCCHDAVGCCAQPKGTELTCREPA
jgi:hypothetical protein